MATTYLSKTQIAGTSTRKMTISAWVKRSGLVGYAKGAIWSMGSDSSNFIELQFNDADRLELKAKNSGSYVMRKATNALYRDTSAWYHIVVGIDSDQSTPADRNKIYINGVQYAGTWDTDTDATVNTDFKMNSTSEDARCGRDYMSGAAVYFDGDMAHVHYIDGTQYAASDFGETDSTSGIWVAKTSPSVTYGNNGGFYKFASGASGTDSSGNGNTMAVTGTLTNLKDNPDNNFCTMNPLDNYYPGATFSQGNNTIVTPASSTYAPTTGTIGLTAGKWYWEVKPTTMSLDEELTGITSTQCTSATAQILGYFPNDWAYYANNGNSYNNNTSTSYGNSYAVNDIIGVALDITNSKLYFAKNGTWQNSGVPTSGATGTGAISITAVASTPLEAYFPAQTYWQSASNTVSVNFGNGYFGTTVAGTETDDAGIGLFKYDVPAGYYAICTNNLGDQS